MKLTIIRRVLILFLLTFLLPNELAFANAVKLLRKPTIHNVTPNSLVVVWTTEAGGTSEVQYGVGNFAQTAVATNSLLITDGKSPYDEYYVHEATLTGLTPNTVYQYRIFTDGVNLTPGGSVDVRSGRGPSDRTFRFAAFGDSGTGSSGQLGVAERLLQVAPDLVVHGGDMVYDTNYQTIETKHFQIYEDLLDHVWLPPTVGNHDMHNNGAVIADSFVNPPNPSSDPIERELYYSFDYGNAHFTVLATELSLSNNSDQVNWLEADLANSDQFWKVVVIHEPPYTGDGKKFGSLVDLFEEHGVDIVISGDRHFYERMKLIKNDNVSTVEAGGILYMVTGGGGTGLGSIGDPPWPSRTAERALLYHLIMFDVDDCRVEMSAVEQSTGDSFDATDIFDSFLLDKCGDGPTASLTADVRSGQAPLAVQFTDLSSGNPTQWQWDFGDGSSSTQQHPSHTYTTPGVYTVELEVSNGSKSSSDRRTDYITVSEPAVEFSLATAAVTVAETAVSTTINVQLAEPASETATVDYAVVADSATAGLDYTPITGTLSFGVGESSQPLTIPILDDALDEAAETAVLRLSNPSLGTIGTPSEAVITITDDDEPPTVQFAAPDFAIGESGSSGVVTATLSTASGQRVTVDVVSSDGTAVVDADYSGVDKTIIFMPGEISQTVAVPILEDQIQEPDETVTLTLGNPENVLLAAPSAATLTILDNDPPPQISFASATYTETESGGTAVIPVTLLGATTKTVTVDLLTGDKTAVAAADYEAVTTTLTFLPGTITETVSIPLLDDELDEFAETVALTLTNWVNADPGSLLTSELIIEDEDAPPTIAFSQAAWSVSEGAGTVTMTVDLAAPSAKPITVELVGEGKTAVSGTDFAPISGTLTLTPGTTSQTFVVTLLDDPIDELSETAVVTLTNPSNAVLAAPSVATLTLTDDDAPPAVQFATATAAIGEADGSLTISVTLAVESAQTVQVAAATVAGTAVAGADFTAVNETLVFAPGETVQTVTVPLLNDELVEPNKQFTLVLSQPNKATLGDPAVLMVTLVDDDQPAVGFAETAVTLAEDEPILSVQVVLSEVSPLAVSVDYETVAETAVAGDYTPISGTLSFAPGETVKTIVVDITDDALDEPVESFAVQLVAAEGGRFEDNDRLTVTLNDNDAPPTVGFASSIFWGDEDGGETAVLVLLSKPSGKPITLNFATLAGTATANVDFTPVLTSITFAPGTTSQTILVPLLPDELLEGNEQIELLLGDVVNATWGEPTTAVLTIVDGDTTTIYLPVMRRGG